MRHCGYFACLYLYFLARGGWEHTVRKCVVSVSVWCVCGKSEWCECGCAVCE